VLETAYNLPMPASSKEMSAMTIKIQKYLVDPPTNETVMCVVALTILLIVVTLRSRKARAPRNKRVVVSTGLTNQGTAYQKRQIW